MKKKRKTYSPKEKVYLLKKHLVNGVAVSQICEENQCNRPYFTAGNINFLSKVRQVQKRLPPRKSLLSPLRKKNCQARRKIRQEKRKSWAS